MSVLSSIIDNQRMQNIRNEFGRLGDKCYLENAGTALYPETLLTKINDDLLRNVYFNPHSDKYTKDCIEQIRCTVLNHFNTDQSTYSLIFTSGTTQSLKLVLESFQFHSEHDDDIEKVNGSFIYLRDNHTSVIGLRELAEAKNTDIIHISHDDFLNTLKTCKRSKIQNYKNAKEKSNTLLAYPAQSNFNGYKYPIDCVQEIRNGCLNSYLKKQLCEVNCNWYILLDAASFVPTSKLDLSITQPDFVCLSFYKIFGFPSGLGALLVKNSCVDVLKEKRYFGGGTVDIVLSSEDFHVKRQSLHERFEDGTLPFLSIIALKHCFSVMSCLIPKVINNDIMDTLSHHTFYLAKDLFKQLSELVHSNGTKAAVLYMDSDFTDIKRQGGIVTFNLIREDGTYIGYAEHMADLFNISLRTGCFCNSGSCQRHLNVTNKEMKSMHKAGHKCGDEMDIVNGRPTGAVRVSFGYHNTFNDVDKLVSMITKCFVRKQYQKPKRCIMNHNINKVEVVKTNSSKFKEEILAVLNEKILRNGCPEIFNTGSKATLSEIAIFPIKSCGAFKIKSDWKIGPKGFEYDREWMIVKDNGVCLTQKQNTEMCMIRPVIDFKHRRLTLNFKGSAISIPLDISHSDKYTERSTTPFCQSKVCTDIVKGYDCGDAVADWISNALGISYLRLIRQANDDKRIQKKKNNDEKSLLSLSNQAQFLLINRATVKWLKSKIRDSTFTDDVDSLTDRFRGNLVIDTAHELIEREWQMVTIGNHQFKVEGPCSRCQMVCIDQKTGEKTVEPLRTISEEFGGKMRFGIYLSYLGPVNGPCKIKTKDLILHVASQVTPYLSDDNISR